MPKQNGHAQYKDEKHLLPMHTNGTVEAAAPTKIFGLSRKQLSLIVLTLQNATLTLMMSYSRIAPQRSSSPMYIASTAVFFAEIAKLLACFAVLYHQSGQNTSRFVNMIRNDVLGQPKEILKLVVPSFLYALQNNLLYVALSNLEAATFQVTYQMKILTTAIFSVLLLGRSLSRFKWIALVLLMTGVALVQLQNVTARMPDRQIVQETVEQVSKMAGAVGAVAAAAVDQVAEGAKDAVAAVAAAAVAAADGDFVGLAIDTAKDAADTAGHAPYSPIPPVPRKHRPLFGLVAVVLSCLSSGFAGCYFEKILKTSNTSMWVRNIQLGLSGLFFSFFAMLVNDHNRILQGGIFQGYDFLTWSVVSNQAIGGLLVAIVVKYADNILKGFATSLSIIISALFSFYFLGFHPTGHFVLGTMIVMYATWLFGRPDPAMSASTSTSINTKHLGSASAHRLSSAFLIKTKR